MSPFKRRRLWQLVPVLLCGAALLVFLPAGQPAVNHVAAPTDTQPAAPPAGLETASLSVPASAGTTKPAAASNGVALASAGIPADGSAGPSGSEVADPTTAELSAPQETPPPNLPDGLTDGRIGLTAVNARSGPSVDNDKLFVMSPGEAIKIGETNGSWVHVYRQDGTDGWVFGRYIAGHEPPPSADPPQQAVTRAASADTDESPPAGRLVGRMGEAHSLITARRGPDSSALPAFLLQPGDRFRIAQSRGGWILIITEDGMSGWIAS